MKGGTGAYRLAYQKFRHSSDGFTIVETMIVLAVTGLIILGAVVAMEGRTNKTEFMTSINDLQSQLQQIVSDVADGYYPNSGGFTCHSSGNTLNFNPGPTGPATQGTNQGCTFIGKAIQFGVPSGNNQVYSIFTIAGLQCLGGGEGTACQPPDTLADSKPTALYPALGYDNTQLIPITLVETQALEYGLSAQRSSTPAGNHSGVYYNGNPANQISTVALVATPTEASSQQVELYAISPSPALGSSNLGDTAKAINDSLQTVPRQATSVEVCVESGTTTNESGLITFGGSGQQTTVSLQIFSDGYC